MLIPDGGADLICPEKIVEPSREPVENHISLSCFKTLRLGLTPNPSGQPLNLSISEVNL